MDLQRLKQLSEAKIKAGTITKQVRDTLKEYKHDKQDLQQGLSETFKPIIKAQEETKQTIDEKQDKLIEQLEKNQKSVDFRFGRHCYVNLSTRNTITRSKATNWL